MIMTGVSKEVFVMQSIINQVVSQYKDNFGQELSQEVRELTATKSRDTAAGVRKLRELLGDLFSLAAKGGYQVYIFVDNIDAMYPPPPGRAEAAEPGRENDFDEFVRMLKETVQCGRETARKSQQQINVLVTSRRLCEEKYLASKEVSLSKSLRFGETPRMNISKVLFPAIVPVREVRMAILTNQKNASDDDKGVVRERVREGRRPDDVSGQDNREVSG